MNQLRCSVPNHPNGCGCQPDTPPPPREEPLGWWDSILVRLLRKRLTKEERTIIQNGLDDTTKEPRAPRLKRLT